MTADDLARSEEFAREIHRMYPAGQLDAFMAEYDRLKVENADLREWKHSRQMDAMKAREWD